MANRKSDVFLRADFEAFGSRSQIGRALAELISSGALLRVGIGVYVKAKPSVLSGKPIPIRPLEVLAPEILKRLGVQVKESRQMREYNSGASTQVPVGFVVCVGKRRIQRKLGLNGKIVEYEQR